MREARLVQHQHGPLRWPDRLAAAALAAERAGFDSVWAGEHVVLPDPQVAPSPMAPQDPALDPVVALPWAAAATSTIRVASGIIIVPQRNPVVLAKQRASLDVLSRGRLTFGVAVGYLEPITWDQGKEMNEHIQFSVDTGVEVYSATPRAHGSAGRTRTPTACCASTSRKAPSFPATAKPTSTPWPANSTGGLAEHSAV